MNINLNSLYWQEILELAIKKKAFMVAKAEYDKKSAFRKIFDSIWGMKPRDPAKGISCDDLALRYVCEFNQTHAFGKGRYFGHRVELSPGKTLFVGMRYDVATLLPVLSIVYYEDGTAYVEKKGYLKDGGVEKWAIPYPLSEIGLYGIPERSELPDLAIAVNSFNKAVEEVRGVLTHILR